MLLNECNFDSWAAPVLASFGPAPMLAFEFACVRFGVEGQTIERTRLSNLHVNSHTHKSKGNPSTIASHKLKVECIVCKSELKK